MGNTVRKTISLPPDLAEQVDDLARAEGKSASAVIREALRIAGKVRQKEELRRAQGYWSRIARERGLLSEEDLEQFLAE